MQDNDPKHIFICTYLDGGKGSNMVEEPPESPDLKHDWESMAWTHSTRNQAKSQAWVEVNSSATGY